MRRALVLFSFFVSLQAAALELPRANEKWITLRVDEFEIISNASPAATTDIAENLLRMRAAVGQVTQLNVRSTLPTKVFIFGSERSFAPYRDLAFQRKAENITGVFLGGDTGNFILLQSGSPRGVDAVVYHELTHYFVKNTVAGLPVWAGEGLAEYYSTFQISGDDVQIGLPVTEHVRWLRSEKLIPLNELFAVDHDSPIYNETSRRGVFYAESWALMHYLMDDNERRAQFARFLGLVGAHKPLQEAFETAFATTYAKMEQDLRAYVRRYAFNYSKYSLSQLTVPDVPKPEPLTYAAYVYQLGDLVAHSDPDSGPLAEQFLGEALKADPANAGAHADLGWLHDLAGRAQDAEAAYQRAVQLGSSDPQIYLLYGSSIIRRLAKTGARPSNEELVKTRRLFERSAQLAPQSARAWAGIGATYVGSTDPSAPGIAALQKSLALTPGDEEAAFNLVQLYAREGRRADAVKLIDRVIAPAGDRDLLTRAREALVMADLHDMESLANEGKVKEALVIARAALEKTTNPALVEHLRSTIASMETWDAADSAANALNDAVAKANGGKYAEALAIVDGLLPSITDPDILEKAKQFRDQVAERANRGKRK